MRKMTITPHLKGNKGFEKAFLWEQKTQGAHTYVEKKPSLRIHQENAN